MKFTPVTVKRGTDHLVRTTGFWSKKPILINIASEPTIHLLDESTKTSDLLTCINSFIDAHLLDWLTASYKEWVSSVIKGKYHSPFFSIQSLPSLFRPEWVSKGKISAPQLINSLKSQGKNTEEICQYLAEAWVKDWRNRPSLDIKYLWGVPENLSQSKLLILPWSRMNASDTAEEFLKKLSNLAEMDLSSTRLFGAAPPKDRWLKANSGVFQKELSERERNLLKYFGVEHLLSTSSIGGDTRMILALPQCASLALALLARVEYILVSDYLPGNLNAATTDLGMQASFTSINARSSRAALSSLLMSSNIRTVEDVPANLRDYNPKGQAWSHLWKPLRSLLWDYAKENSLTQFDIAPFERGGGWRKEVLKWTPQWFIEEKHPDEWSKFAACAFDTSEAGENKKIERLRVLAGWGLSRFSSPWDIKPVDLRNPSIPNDPNTFFAHCRGLDRDSYHAWADSSYTFKSVVNAAAIPGYPWFRENAINPFNNIANPFSSSTSRGNGKTHRSRIGTVIHEKMIEVLLDLDENGTPTFQWAKNCLLRKEDVKDGVWCPSRWTLLATLLLLPLRKKQGRWLDQGLMDEKVFNPETFQMVENTHHLRGYTYEDGDTHLRRYGRPTGAIQPITDPFMGATNHLGIFVNTNKTQLWNPTKHNGYELPWPDGSELLSSDDEELQQHGTWLRRVYEVLAYQYRYVLEHDPEPVPITFYDTSDDIGLVSQHDHIKSRMPFFVPLFRDVANPKQVRRGEDLLQACLPLSPAKILSAYTALCMEVESRLHSEGFEAVTLTTLSSKGRRSDEDCSGVVYRTPKFDLHCLRVAGISRLIEIGIDPEIIQEFVAGHLTAAMTHRYIKLQPWHAREKIIEAIVNGDFKTAIESFAEKVSKGESSPEATFVSLARFREHINDLPEDFACFAVVEGGICIAGGKGDPCDEGGVYERDVEKRDEAETYFGPVRGGCGNCRHFRSAFFLIQEQALYLDVLMLELRALARQRKEIRTKISDFKCQIDDCEDALKQTRLLNDMNLHKGRLESLNHNMVPAITEWVNRYQILIECEAQMEDGQPTALVAPFLSQGLTADDLKVDIEMTTDIGVLARFIEKARVLSCRGIPIPEDKARMLEQAADGLLRMNGSSSLLLDITSRYRTQGASMIINMLEDLVGAEKIQDSLDNSKPLVFLESQREAINRFASAIVEAGNNGPLTVDSVIGVATSGNLITEEKIGGEIWAI